MSNTIQEVGVWPVNKDGELLLQYGKGGSTYFGALDATLIPTDTLSNKVPVVFPEELATYLALATAGLPSSRYKMSPTSAANPVFDVQPTHYFDPTASVSTAEGTFTNPFNTLLQVETYFNTTLAGAAYGKVLGWKRGTVVRGKLDLTITGFGSGTTNKSLDNPFMIVPYGTGKMPKLIGAVVVNTWTFDGVFWWYDTGTNREVDVFQDGKRIYKKNNRSQALAAGPGFGYWVANKVFVLPYNSVKDFNSNSILVEVTSSFGGLANNSGNTLSVKYRNQARTGNIIIAGIEVDKSINSCISITAPGTNGAITLIDNIQLIGCVTTNAGVDQTAVGAGCDGIVVSGVNDSVRIANLYIGSCYSKDCLNNAVEVNGIASGIVEWNTSTGCGGNSIIELYASVSNLVVRYNFGFGAGNYAARTSEAYHGGGIWLPGYAWDIAGEDVDNTDITKNSGNSFMFNIVLNAKSEAMALEGGTLHRAYNNTFHTLGVDDNGNGTGTPTVTVATNAKMVLPATIEFYNNLVLNTGQDNIVFLLGRGSGAVRNVSMTGDGNIYWNTAIGAGQNGTISTLDGNGNTITAQFKTFTNSDAWRAALATLGGSAAEGKSKFANPRFDLVTGKPQFGSVAATMPVAPPTGYFVDITGRYLATSFSGAAQL